MTVPFVLIAGYAAGALLAFTARRPLVATHQPIRNRYFVITVLFAFGAVMPAGMAIFMLFPDWSLMYLANPAHFPQMVVIPMLMLSYTAAPPIGFLATHRLLQLEKNRELRYMVLGIIAITALTVLLSWNRLTTVAFYDAFHYGHGIIPLIRSSLLLPLLLHICALTFVFVFTLTRVRRHLTVVEDLSALRAFEPNQTNRGLYAATEAHSNEEDAPA